MAKRRKKKSDGLQTSTKLALGGGALGGFWQAAQYKTQVKGVRLGNQVLPVKTKVPLGKAGMAMAVGGIAGVYGGQVYDAVKNIKRNKQGKSTSFLSDALLKNPLSAAGGALAGYGAGKLALKGAKSLRKVSKAYKYKRAAKAAKDVTPKGDVVFRRIGGRVIPIRRKR